MANRSQRPTARGRRTPSRQLRKTLQPGSETRAQTPARPGTRARSLPDSPTGPRFDVLTDVVEQVHLDGTVYFSAELHAPWGIAIARAGRTPFYLVRSGRAEMQVGARGRPIVLEAGDFALLPNAAPHVVRSGRGAQVIPFDDWLALHPMDASGRSVHAGRGDETRVIGGFFSSGGAAANPLFAALPSSIVLRGTDPRVRRWLEPTLAFIEGEIDARAQGSGAVLQRLADVLFIQAVRAHAAQEQATGWLRGMSDRRIARALALLHERYAEGWTLDRLAHETGMSRTALAVRFRELVGEAPMAYLTRWRVTRAANLLRGRDGDLERTASAVGYRSGTVFAKAFKRVTGVSPGRYRHSAPLAANVPAAPGRPSASG
jgi:AraC-like DNA-binding protein/mannose-6-phosphate isomerase-like protein (cupin superfamily)